MIYLTLRGTPILPAHKDALLAGGVDTMEKYRYLVGQAHGIQLTLQDISNLLKPKEQKNEQGNIIDIGDGKGSTKN